MLDPIDDTDAPDPEDGLRDMSLRHIRDTLHAIDNALTDERISPIRALRLFRAYSAATLEFMGELAMDDEDTFEGRRRRFRGALPMPGVGAEREPIRQMMGALTPAMDAHRLQALLSALRTAEDIGDEALIARLRAEVNGILGVNTQVSVGER